MATEEITLRSYNKRIDRSRIEKLEQKCEVAELNNELVGVIQGTIKKATINCPEESQARVGYILGLRVSPLHRRKYIGSTLVRTLEQWFIANDVDFAYMATGKDNEASVKLFTDKLGF
ncbi:hypothetical protein GIB67_017113 [Kingdonia uniflora]|uniref:N-acetyltransferase domain-containing protein n=1 Tax=Kingdonia uniflora TaxID=39325 RepID=A0A7J7ND28_9MAGN|nr:hypothetical protein GIB67_017113 [Kingdonia uniflora]